MWQGVSATYSLKNIDRCYMVDCRTLVRAQRSTVHQRGVTRLPGALPGRGHSCRSLQRCLWTSWILKRHSARLRRCTSSWWQMLVPCPHCSGCWRADVLWKMTLRTCLKPYGPTLYGFRLRHASVRMVLTRPFQSLSACLPGPFSIPQNPLRRKVWHHNKFWPLG